LGAGRKSRGLAPQAVIRALPIQLGLGLQQWILIGGPIEFLTVLHVGLTYKTDKNPTGFLRSYRIQFELLFVTDVQDRRESYRINSVLQRSFQVLQDRPTGLLRSCGLYSSINRQTYASPTGLFRSYRIPFKSYIGQTYRTNDSPIGLFQSYRTPFKSYRTDLLDRC
jgi:hypothetical protein